ncbi:MAG TPA: outer membrane beta-barrel protein [Acidobacteriota bacterium]|nr:outer membrane beta-barrel protein [Acidobacteriota bacterium]
MKTKSNAHLFIGMVFLFLICGATAWAAEPKGEVSVMLGWTFSDGVSGDNYLAPDGNVYNRIDPKDSFSWGFSGEFYVTENAEVGFLYDRQQSKLEVSGTTTREVGNMAVDNYHGIFSYNFGESDATMRPFMLAGIGATHFAGLTFTGFNGASHEIPSETKVSATIGGGVKIYPSHSVGFRLQARWTPTYVKSDSAGWWCDPYWGCYVVSNAQYANQFEMAGAFSVRF